MVDISKHAIVRNQEKLEDDFKAEKPLKSSIVDVDTAYALIGYTPAHAKHIGILPDLASDNYIHKLHKKALKRSFKKAAVNRALVLIQRHRKSVKQSGNPVADASLVNEVKVDGEGGGVQPRGETVWHEFYRNSDAKVVLRSDDGVHFRAYSGVLTKVSKKLRSILSTSGKADEVIVMSTNSTTLALFLDIASVSDLSIISIAAEDLGDLLLFCRQYDCDTLNFFVETELRYKVAAEQIQPDTLLIVASDLNDLNLAKEAIRRFEDYMFFPVSYSQGGYGSTDRLFNLVGRLSKEYGCEFLRRIFPLYTPLRSGKLSASMDVDWESIADQFSPAL